MTAKGQKLLGTDAEFEEFLSGFDNAEFRKQAIQRADLSVVQVTNALNTYFSEMRFGHQFLEKYLPAGKLRILEVGSGLGLLSIFLKQCGHDVVALEPAALSFDLFDATKKLIWENTKIEMPQLLEITAEELDPSEHGKFDFIFSINVMEHIADIDKATDAILSVLSSEGRCINSCPNYWVPYEPHYAIPMLPFTPSLTRKVFAGKINTNPELWETLNFISVGKVRKMARRNQCNVQFEKRMIYNSFNRLAEDKAFLQRHQNGMVGRIYRFLVITRLLHLLKFLPVAMSTPMIFSYEFKNEL